MKFAPFGRRTLASSRRLCGAFVHRKQGLSPTRALEIARKIQFHQVTLHRRETASGLTKLQPEQRDLFDALKLPKPAASGL